MKDNRTGGFRAVGFGTRLSSKSRSIRLKGYDYKQAGAYFVTICTQDRVCLFGDVVDGQMRLNREGRVVETVWHEIPNHYPHVQLEAFVVMPNHVHGIIVIVGAGFKPAPTTKHGLSEIVRAFKTFSSRRINEMRNTRGVAVWQRNFYEHIIRNEGSLHRIREYIQNNPFQWAFDRENPNMLESCAQTRGSAPTRHEPWFTWPNQPSNPPPSPGWKPLAGGSPTAPTSRRACPPPIFSATCFPPTN